jgi:hypothetical protein
VRRKEHSHAKRFAEVDLQFSGTGAQEFNRETTKNSCTITTGAVSVDTPAMGKSFERLQRKFQDFAGWRSGKARDETCTTGIVVRVPPVRLAPPATHSRVIKAACGEVQCRIFLECIRNAGERRRASALELRSFAKVKFLDFH